MIMSNKIGITICCGTYCHIMGGAELQMIDEYISPELLEQTEIKFSNCMGYCKDNYGNPPFVEINGSLLSEATKEKIIGRLKQIMGGMTYDYNQ